MEQTKALNALEPFLALTKSATSPRAAADLIARATAARDTYVFAELLSAPQIQALADAPEQASSLTLLKIFSYGTYSDYSSTPGLPPLDDAQTLKLRQLSLLTLAQDPANLSYEKLIVSLELETARELEDLVISAIYAGLVTGTLDPANKRVALSSVAPLRDLPPNSIPALITTLQAWSSRCTTTLSSLEAQINEIRSSASRRAREEKEWNVYVEEMMTKNEKAADQWGAAGAGAAAGGSTGVGRTVGNWLTGGGSGGSGTTGGKVKRGSSADDGDEAMELDEENEKPNKKRVGGGIFSSFGGR